MDKNATKSFNDVNYTDWYSIYVASAVKAGIMVGKSNKIFAPDDYISRQDAAVLLSKILDEQIIENVLTSF